MSRPAKVRRDALLRRSWRTMTPETLRGLIEAGADPRTATRHGTTPIHHCVNTPREDDGDPIDDLVAILLEHGADPSAASHGMGWPPDTDDPITPLALAVSTERTGCIRLLLRAGADPTHACHGASLLATACRRDRADWIAIALATSATVVDPETTANIDIVVASAIDHPVHLRLGLGMDAAMGAPDTPEVRRRRIWNALVAAAMGDAPGRIPPADDDAGRAWTETAMASCAGRPWALRFIAAVAS